MNIYIIIIFIFFIIIIVITLFWILILKSPPSEQKLPKITYIDASYGMRCSPNNVEVSSINIPSQYIPQHCGEGLECINYVTTETYFVNNGYPCNVAYKCDPSIKTCSSLECSTTSETNLCKVKIGYFCNNLNECEPSASKCEDICIG